MYTTNNNSSMKTEVETFIIEETQELIYDNEKLEQWNRHVQELGLQGQTQIAAKDKSPIPFLYMKQSLVNVFTTLCPRKVDISEYNKTPIPLELLDLVALSKKEQYFDEIQVWYDDATPDPAIIGVKRNSQFDEKYPTWDRGLDKYLIGRWADVKMSLEALTEKAKAIYKAGRTIFLQNEIRDAQRKLDDLEKETAQNFGTIPPAISGWPF